MSKQPGINLLIKVVGLELDAEELDALTRRLQAEISELPVENVTPASDGSAPDGTKASTGIRPGTLSISLEPGVLPPLFEQLKSWTARQATGTVKLTLNVADRFEFNPATTSPEQISALVKELEQPPSEQ